MLRQMFLLELYQRRVNAVLFVEHIETAVPLVGKPEDMEQERFVPPCLLVVGINRKAQSCESPAFFIRHAEGARSLC